MYTYIKYTNVIKYLVILRYFITLVSCIYVYNDQRFYNWSDKEFYIVLTLLVKDILSILLII